MSAISTTFSGQQSKAIPTILTAGLIAGTMDMTAACIKPTTAPVPLRRR